MVSTYSPALRLELMTTGDQSGTWGVTTNTNLGTLLEQSITGYAAIAQGDVANLTLTTTNGSSDQARNAVIKITGALTAARNVVVQTPNKVYIVQNGTTGGFSLTFKTSGGTGVVVPNGATALIYSDGTNVLSVSGAAISAASNTLTYIDAGATVGPVFDLFRDSSSPAASDLIGKVQFDGRDSGAAVQEYANIFATITDATAASEDATLKAQVVVAGTLTTIWTASLTGLDVVGTITATGAVTAAGATPATLTYVDAGAAVGPTLDLFRDSASPAVNDLIPRVNFSGRNSAAAKVSYAGIYAKLLNVTAGTELSSLIFETNNFGAPVIMTFDGNGLLTVAALTYNKGAITTGLYSPTITGTANVAASTTAVCNFSRNGDMVAVYGSVAIDPTTITTLTTFELSLPVASNFAAITDCNGTAVSPVSGAPEVWSVVGSIANDRAVFLSVVTTAANHVVYFSFQYQVI